MQQILLLILLFGGAFAIRQPTCPNDDLPKLDKNGRFIQCIPGSSSRIVCGDGYACFFSGMNYMCCPSSEPTIKSQIVCPGQALTVLDSSGQPMKCNTWTYACPKASQKCSLVGRDYICCEHIGGTAQLAATEKPRTKAPKMPSQPLECPSNSIGLLNRNGLPVVCNSKKRCPSKAYCHSVGGQSICCESYEFASNILDPTPTENNIRRSETKAPLQVLDRSSLTVANNAEVERSPSRTLVSRSRSAEQENYRRNTIQLKQSLEKKAAVRTTSGSASTLISSEASSLKSVPVSMADGVAEMSSERVSNIPTTTEKSESVATTEQIRAPPKRKAPAAFAAVSVPEQGNQVKPLSPNLPSQLFSGQDKRIMAEQFLMHQIRNGWPYDEKFYRPDVDTYSPQQRQRMAQIFFSDNQ